MARSRSFSQRDFLASTAAVSCIFCVSNNFMLKALIKSGKSPKHFQGAGRTNIRRILRSVPSSGSSQVSPPDGNCRMSGVWLVGPIGC